MKIHTLGTCAGTEPMPTRQHASIAFESNGTYYLFDAGCGCARTAHLMGLPINMIGKIFISHRHRDHTGGLPDLFWDIRKLVLMFEKEHPEKIDLFLPEMFVWDCVYAMLNLGWGEGVNIVPRLITEGVIFEDENIKVEARHNLHLGDTPDALPSYSFRITAEGKQFIYSGDVRSYTDMGDWLNSCDLLLMETGHHKASEVCAGIRADGLGVKQIMFVHSGREILNDYAGARERAEQAWGEEIIIAEDGTTYEF